MQPCRDKFLVEFRSPAVEAALQPLLPALETFFAQCCAARATSWTSSGNALRPLGEARKASLISAGDCVLTFNDILTILRTAGLFKDNYGPKQACISFMAVTGDDGLSYSEHKCNEEAQMIFPEFVELLARRTRAMCGSGVTLPDAIGAALGSDVTALKGCGLADK